MPSTAVAPQIETEIPRGTVPDAPKRGRPRNSPTPAEPASPAGAPGGDNSATPFFERLKAATSADWERYMVYLYRLQPITDTTNGGQGKNLHSRPPRSCRDHVARRDQGFDHGRRCFDGLHG